MTEHSKITAGDLARQAIVYLRQFHALGRLPVAVLVLASRKSMPLP